MQRICFKEQNFSVKPFAYVKGPVQLMQRVKIAHSFLQSVSNQFHVIILSLPLPTYQSQKTQGFCVADFATLSDETRSRSKIFPLFIWLKEPCVRKFERHERSKLLGISQTNITVKEFFETHF